jgi:hypothetical protein
MNIVVQSKGCKIRFTQRIKLIIKQQINALRSLRHRFRVELSAAPVPIRDSRFEFERKLAEQAPKQLHNDQSIRTSTLCPLHPLDQLNRRVGERKPFQRWKVARQPTRLHLRQRSHLWRSLFSLSTHVACERIEHPTAVDRARARRRRADRPFPRPVRCPMLRGRERHTAPHRAFAAVFTGGPPSPARSILAIRAACRRNARHSRFRAPRALVYRTFDPTSDAESTVFSRTSQQTPRDEMPPPGPRARDALVGYPGSRCERDTHGCTHRWR